MRLALEIGESFNIARSAIMANKGRGALTTLGIVIGVVAVITTMTAANGLKNSFQESFSSIGSDVLYVSRTPWVHMGNFMEFRNRRNISLDDTEQLSEALYGRGVVNPGIGTDVSVKYGSETLDNVTVFGTTDKQIVVSNIVPELGRFLMPFDVAYKKNVVVIGSAVSEALFGSLKEAGLKRKLSDIKGAVAKATQAQQKFARSLQEAGASMFLFRRSSRHSATAAGGPTSTSRSRPLRRKSSPTSSTK